MPARPPAFPPDVASRLQRPGGSVSFRYTLPEPLDVPPRRDWVLMETPYQRALTSLTLDTKLNLRFTRVDEGGAARTAYVPADALRGTRFWDVSLSWDSAELVLQVRDQLDEDGPVLEGRYPNAAA